MANWKRTLTSDQVEEAVKFYQLGNSIRKTAEKFNVHHSTMSAYFKERDVSVRHQKRPVEWIDDERIRCSRCSNIVHKSNVTFSTNKTTHRDGYYLSYCKDCRRGQAKESRLALGPNWRERATRCNARALKVGLVGDLTGEQLQYLWGEQDGKCFYTDVTLVADYGSGILPTSLSIDRIRFDEGYTLDNVVLCTYRVNSIKRDVSLVELREWMPGWYARLVASGKLS